MELSKAGLNKRLVIPLILALFVDSTLVTGVDFRPGSEEDLLTYSFVHITDTQTLCESFPETLNSTFTYLESIRSLYSIKAIIHTGDIVQHWNVTREWESYVAAKALTLIPVYEIAGNHDNNWGANFTFYDRYVGRDKEYYCIVVEDFVLLLISLPKDNLLNQTVLENFSRVINTYPEELKIICTHYYMENEVRNSSFSLSYIGEQITENLVSSPTIILCGHIVADINNTRVVNNASVYEFVTNYQGQNASYVRLFRVYKGRSFKKITVSTLRICKEPAAFVTAETTFYSSEVYPGYVEVLVVSSLIQALLVFLLCIRIYVKHRY